MSTLATIYKRPSVPIQAEHLSHIVGEANYSCLHFIDGSQVLFSRTLKTYQDTLPDFIRISKSLLINRQQITAWKRRGVNDMHVTVGEVRYEVARRRVVEEAYKLQHHQPGS
jgi:DNA-binding LytR/AlgR family response regulator